MLSPKFVKEWYNTHEKVKETLEYFYICELRHNKYKTGFGCFASGVLLPAFHSPPLQVHLESKRIIILQNGKK